MTVEQLKRDIRESTESFVHRRTVQNAFKRAYSKNEFGDLHETLIPPAIMERSAILEVKRSSTQWISFLGKNLPMTKNEQRPSAKREDATSNT